VDKFEQV